ncbi:MAG: hypothetical protein JW751_06385 [Polyangiaceae bacterium]|nr:hypothetical protein [Polyangiaceae bacterium]
MVRRSPPLLGSLQAVVLLLGGLAACDIEAVEEETPPSDGSLGSECEENADCDDDLACPAGGHLAEHCAATCGTDSDCTIAAGNSYYCLLGLCTRVCADTCSYGARVVACAAYERCVAQNRLESGATDCLAWCVPR